MRIGANPQKFKNEKNTLKSHRIILVIYNPESNDDYYTDLDEVLDKSLKSLVTTINFTTTNITLINNGSSIKSTVVINKYLHLIDKYVVYGENKGKVYAVLNEVRAIFEPFVTIADSDILFYANWEFAVFECFKKFKNSGVVSPIASPHCAFNFNKHIFGSFFFKIKYSAAMRHEDIELCKSSFTQFIFNRNNSNYEDFDKKQYIIKDNGFAVLLGASHCIATYRRELFSQKPIKFPYLKFKNGYENTFIDCLAEQNGYYRISTVSNYAYHIGNKLDQNCYLPIDDRLIDVTPVFFELTPFKVKNRFFVKLVNFVGRILIKYYFNRK